MKTRGLFILILGALALTLCISRGAPAGQVHKNLSVLVPITHGNLSIFPVVSDSMHDTHSFLTLDQGLRSGDVVVTEAGQSGLVRPRGTHQRPVRYEQGSDEVNRLVLMNNSNRPLILLAGEVVTGGKQDRIVAKDRIVPPNSDPVDLTVFCIEPGRWVESSTNFKTSASSGAGFLVQPSVRREAMAAKDQHEVWNAVGNSNRALADNVASAPSQSAQMQSSTTSYAKMMQNETVKNKVDDEAKPIEHSYASVLGQLKDQHAVGVVVAVNGQIVWADIFGSSDLLQQYWPKLIRSYVAESLSASGNGSKPATLEDAQRFLEHQEATHEVVDSEPGVYRQTEKSGEGYKVFALQSLLPGKDFDVHISKMTTR